VKLKYFLYGLIIIIVVGAAAVGYKLHQKHHDIWLYDYVFDQDTRSQAEQSDGVQDIIFTVVDHWEPGCHVPDENMRLVNAWMVGYPKLADKHIDSDGKKVQHTFFYPLEAFRGCQVDSLVKLCRAGYGDVELHWHHRDDNSESFRRKLITGLDSFLVHGALVSPDSVMRFAFVHGNYALDNSIHINGHNLCGVNDEISILLDEGCYADFTFPALEQTSQPELVNKIFYVVDDPLHEKSQNSGVQSKVGIVTNKDQLMIFEGPMMINWHDWRFKTHPVIDDGNIYNDMKASLERFELWKKADIHVIDGPNWVFVRPYTHGCLESHGGVEANLGPEMDAMLTAVEEKYRDSDKYRLHYMTAREAYNVVKAAEAGKTGNPNDYRDFVIKPYTYEPLTKPITERASNSLQ
jgi:hypothetical protein